ncbi:hypothetical protein D3C85_1398970 [compost metagenome]
MQRYGLNHDPVDYAEYRREHLDEFPEMLAQGEAQRPVPETSADVIADRVQKIIVAVTLGGAIAALVSSLDAVAPSAFEGFISYWKQVLS